MRATALSVLVLLGLLAMPTSAAGQPADPPSVPQTGDVTLGGDAGSVLVGLTLRPGEPGSNDVLVHLLPPGGEADAAPLQALVDVEGRPAVVQRCGAACRRATATLAGGEEVMVTVAGEEGGTATFAVPPLPAPPAGALLEEATQRCGR